MPAATGTVQRTNQILYINVEFPEVNNLMQSGIESLRFIYMYPSPRSMNDKDWEEIGRYLHLIELAPKLIECGLLELGDTPDNTLESRQRFVSFIRQGGKDSLNKFSLCFETKDDHLGHDYIACLLKGRPFANGATVRRSSEYRSRIKQNMSIVVTLLNLKYLTPHLLACRLLTPDEATSLKHSSRKCVLKLFEALERKGPTAFDVFVKCLHNESEHSGHQELFSRLFKSQGMSPPSPKKRKPAQLTVESSLAGKEYHERRHRFEEYYHSGQWCKVNKLAQECMESEVLEIQVVGHLEVALSYIFRLDKAQVMHHIEDAMVICKRIQNTNQTFLFGRCKYLLALLYRYLGEVPAAEKYVEEAKGILFYVEVGEDKSFTVYCDAVISATHLTDKSSEYEFNEVTRKFEMARDYSLHSDDLDILVIYSFLRLGRLYLGTTATKIHITVNKERIQKSMDCLKELKTSYYHKMDERCKSLYHMNESDLYRSHGQTSKAIDSAKQAEKYAKQCNCPMETEAVQIRIKALSSLTA